MMGQLFIIVFVIVAMTGLQVGSLIHEDDESLEEALASLDDSSKEMEGNFTELIRSNNTTSIQRVIYSFTNFMVVGMMELTKTSVEYGYNHPTQANPTLWGKVIIWLLIISILFRTATLALIMGLVFLIHWLWKKVSGLRGGLPK